jgi:glutamyl-Q tRNA(Asp) synthetase
LIARPVFRFAPSPNGDLHLGHALSALTGYEMARAIGGRFLLRIEDIDVTRTREAHVEAIFRDLAWLGLEWETPVLRQSARFDDYRAAASRLEADGILYPCFANRSQINAVVANAPNPRDPDGAPLYPARLRSAAALDAAARRARGEPFALRIDMARAIDAASDKLGGQPLTFTEIGADGRHETRHVRPQRWGDAVIVRKEIPASYHLAVVVDDAFQGVTHVTRGQDLLAATDIHRLLQVLLGLPEPVYHHHALILGEDGQKLSKSAGDTGFAALREAGVTAADVRARLALRIPSAPPRD